MLIELLGVSKNEDSQSFDLPRVALLPVGVLEARFYYDMVLRKQSKRGNNQKNEGLLLPGAPPTAGNKIKQPKLLD